MKSNIEVVALNFPPHAEREQYRIEKGDSTSTGLTPVSMVDNGPSVLVTFTVTEDTSYDRYNEGDTVQREYMKGQLLNVEKVKVEDGESDIVRKARKCGCEGCKAFLEEHEEENDE